MWKERKNVYDPRNIKLAEMLVNYSVEVQPGEKVLIDYTGVECVPLVQQILRQVYQAKGVPFVQCDNPLVTRELMMHCTEEQLKVQDDAALYLMKQMDAYIGIRAAANALEFSDVPAEKYNLYEKLTAPSLNERVDHTKWVILRYPTPSMAQRMNRSQEAFEEFYFNVCTLDYSKMDRAMDALQKRMNEADQVHLVAPGTDLTFSIRGIPAVKCAGKCNVPDGEVYTAPVRDSVNGIITYNTPSEEQGFTFENIRFEIRNGKILKATSNDDERINRILDTDEAARYFGEFAIGVNPYVLHPMKETLFDEKICGSIHLTPGMCYDDAPNGNESAIHWDLVLIQRPEYGGGEIWFDGELIRKDGIFIPEDLRCLNPENLK